MRERFVPSSYIRDLHVKLQKLHQGPFSVEGYHKEMDIISFKGFNGTREIQDVVDLQHYRNLSELVHQAIKVEKQLSRRSACRKTYGGSSGLKGKEKEKDRTRREKSSKKGNEASIG
ncbi:hypothetical protein CR513_03223, partial [Mucuna pruriens]